MSRAKSTPLTHSFIHSILTVSDTERDDVVPKCGTPTLWTKRHRSDAASLHFSVVQKQQNTNQNNYGHKVEISKTMRRRLGLLACMLGATAVESADLRPKAHFVPNVAQAQLAKVHQRKYESIQANIQPSTIQDDSSVDDEIVEESVEPIEKSPSDMSSQQRRWLQITEVDRQIFATTLPLSAIFAIIPLSSSISLFWVNRLGSTLSVAGQAAANQVYSSAFWLFSFLPSVTATLVSKTHASGDLQGTQDAISQAFLFALLISAIGASFMFFATDRALSSILKGTSSIPVMFFVSLPLDTDAFLLSS